MFKFIKEFFFGKPAPVEEAKCPFHQAPVQAKDEPPAVVKVSITDTQPVVDSIEKDPVKPEVTITVKPEPVVKKATKPRPVKTKPVTGKKPPAIKATKKKK